MDISKFRRAGLAALFVGFLAAGCSGSGDDRPTRPQPTAGASATQVAIKGVAFVPSDIEVEAGAEVRWVNRDAVDHTVTSGVQRRQGVPGVEEDEPARPDGRFDAALPDAGDVFTFAFNEPGTFAYYCDVHAGMTGTITVE